jgi:hypothetical protein
MPAPKPAWRIFRCIHRHRFFPTTKSTNRSSTSKSNAIQSATRKTSRTTTGPASKLLEQHALGGRYITVVGSAGQVADELESWIAETGLDGFNLTRIVTPESYEDFIELVIPELQRRGSYKTAYEQGSLREKLFPRQSPHLPEQHTGATYGPLILWRGMIAPARLTCSSRKTCNRFSLTYSHCRGVYTCCYGSALVASEQARDRHNPCIANTQSDN